MVDERIILVDDDELILRSLGQILRLEGYVVETAETGGEAMEKIEEAPPRSGDLGLQASRHHRRRASKDP